MPKIRADQLLVQQEKVSSRNEAQSLIMAGEVYCGDKRIEKQGQLLEESAVLEVRERLPFVSRGGSKLVGALEAFHVNPINRVCLDVGASTGGFTDLLLQRGAKKVYAVDVGFGQLHPKLRQDPRVVVLEKTNFRHLTKDKIPEPIDLAVIDVSFISLEKILPNLKNFLKQDGEAIVLVKPQFELSPKEVKKGVVRSDELRQKAVQKVVTAAEVVGFRPVSQVDSAVPGPKGNREIFLYLIRT